MKNYFFKISFTSFSVCLFSTLIFFITTSAKIFNDKAISTPNILPNGLPLVFNENRGALIEGRLKQDAVLKFSLCRLPLSEKVAWDTYKIQLKNKIIKKTGALLNQQLSLNIKETGSVQMKGYIIKNISFQTRPGIYATANLYVPEGAGNFPGVIVMMGHSAEGRLYEKYQAVGITLALNGYVSLCIDPWGSGERTTIHGLFEDHGDENNLGAALLNIGETLMGMQITDNIRGVDVLCSLPYVDPKNIGATGSSGGGNQTMWLTAMDERIKAAVPVVSVGTFESFIMGSPCICEVLPDGLTFTEEAGVLGLIAPRAIKMCNHDRDNLAAFNPREMLRTYKNAQPVFEVTGKENNIAYQTFNLTHGYWPEDREVMLGWFNLHLKGTGKGEPVKEVSFKTLPNEQLMVYANGKRIPEVVSTEEFCKRRGNELRTVLLNSRFIDAAAKRNQLRDILRIGEKSTLRNVHEYYNVNGWKRFVLETSDDKLIPVLLRTPTVMSKEFVIVCDPAGKENIPTDLVDKLISSGLGIAIVDLSGTGETSSASLHSLDSTGRLRTLSRSWLLLGKTVLGEWVKELNIVTRFVKSNYTSYAITINGSKEAGLAALYLSATEKNVHNIILKNAPLSYLFDNREGIEFFSTAIHLPGFLNWGDVSLVTALSAANTTFIDPVTMSGEKISATDLKIYMVEFEQMRRITKQRGITIFK